MIYDKYDDQWIDDFHYLYGEKLKNVLIDMGYSVITAGNIMVFSFKKKPYLMFQLLQDLRLDEHLRDVNLIGYEVGSFMYFSTDTFGGKPLVPTIRFRDCRMPTKGELNIYNRSKTI